MDSTREELLMELIDKMHGRLADKMYPANPMPDVTKSDEPAAAYPAPAISDTATEACETSEEPVTDHGDTKGDSTGVPGDEMTDEELDEMMKGMTND